ncbi:hypothetical protein HDU85_002073 [Gaertneriomyces sp. JEL0708]|nr:hypothetical protein HDU85_002073 [Gaertneriomyces sp. JEL0708]
MTTTALYLPSPPKTWDANKDYVVHAGVSSFFTQRIEPAGKEFLGVVRRHRHKRTLDEDEEVEKALEDAEAEEGDLDEDEVESPKLLKSDPLKWKEQDHYAVLGLSAMRYKATEEDIKRAYRRKVLKHHPDKNVTGSDSFFKCIQKAWEVMSDPVKRRQWDSVDPKFDEDIPSAKAKGDFFDLYTSVFEKESRFSKTQPIPALGDDSASRDDVEAFYNFWFNFDSWRTFEMLDEDDTDQAESREEKRWLERRNKAERTKRKKADNSRINKFVEQAFAADPRIKKFREQDRAAKDAKKRGKEAAARKAEEEAKRKQEEEAAAKAKAEEEDKQRQAAEKKEREAAKNAVRKEKKSIKRIMRDHNNFLPHDATVSPDAVAIQLSKLDEILEVLDVSGLESFRVRLEEAVPFGTDSLSLVLDEEHMSLVEQKKQQAAAAASNAASTTAASTATKAAKPEWTPKEIATLIKAVKLFPGGAVDRWVKIADYVNEHGWEDDVPTDDRVVRTPKESIHQSKLLQTLQASQREKLQAIQKPKEKPVLETPPTTPTPSVAATPVAAEKVKPPTGPQPTMAPPNANWSAAQQIALEQAMRQFPAMQFRDAPNERWEKIAGVVEGKSVKEIKKRVKELAEMVKNKKKQNA